MSPIHVVGIGLEGSKGLSPGVLQIVEQASVLIGSSRHLSYFPDHQAERIVLGDLAIAIARIRHHLDSCLPSPSPHSPIPLSPSYSSHSTPHTPSIVILTSGDPLFFGLGRLLLTELPAEWLTFHPHLSSVQLAFSRIKLPWQDARIISAHGRSLDELMQALQQGADKIAVLTDNTNTPAAIVHLLQALNLPSSYHFWICENLGGTDEQVRQITDFSSLETLTAAPLNVVILHRSSDIPASLHLETLPLLGIPDQAFLAFSDRPGLMTKREVRILILGELALQPNQIVWDVGAGTGSVSIEVARLCPSSQIYAIEKTATGMALIQKNCDRFQVNNVVPVHGSAPQVLSGLPDPDRIFIGGSGGQLGQILETCSQRLKPAGHIVLALATLEHLTTTLTWLNAQQEDGASQPHHLLQIHLARSVPIAALTRFSPLNPITLVMIEKHPHGFRGFVKTDPFI